mmetsp:Transcript_28809/g.90805  ORF Transcript_28809/g.90805 Transcript_28809/m.90805 type:complete len:382 (+) Transcript_28809:83-1228(+)
MPEVVRREEPIEAFSPSGLWRTTVVQMEVYRDRPAPACALLLFLAAFSASVYRLCRPEMVDPQVAGACLPWDALFVPHPSKWQRYLLHAIWPLEPGYIRAFLTNTVLIVEGYALEYEVGTAHFAGLLVGLHLASAAILLHFRFTLCHLSLEPVLVALAAVMHRVNPKLHSDGLDKSIRVPFPVEPRWHLWIILGVILLTSANFPQALAAHGVGLAAGAICAFRDPEVWQGSLEALQARSFTVGAGVHVALFMFLILFMPLTAKELPADVLSALLDGRALTLGWWRMAVPSSAPALHLALAGQLAGEALFICKLMIISACPLLLSPFRIWARFYAGACVLLLMYSMNSPEWQYPHVGFLALAYLAWAFWKLPNVEFLKPHAA